MMGGTVIKPLRSAFLCSLLGCGVLLAFCATGGFAAGEKAIATTPQQDAFFETKIRPLLANSCYECHSDKDQKGGLRLDSREGLLKGNAHGPAMAPGDIDKSNLLRVVHYDGAIKMPPSGKLRPADIEALTQWVKMGAPWPTVKAPMGGAASGQAPDLKITPVMRSFWSFLPVHKSAVPKVKNVAWCKSPIDRFILAQLESKGVKPAAPADRRTLIRRAYFDLIGLPPTAAEADAFVADKAPNAFEKVIDHLLASPHYGERWGRRWLDVARYSDSNGLDENTAFANAFRYRDYVVAAYNKDKPYNQFIQEQFAGDLMPTEDVALRNERLTATGFLELGPKVLAEPDKPKLVMDIIDEQIEVTSKAVLGLTVACARCHNHKFDPFPTKDYYALAGIFKSTRTMETLNTVARVNERPLKTPGDEEKQKIYAKRMEDLQKALKTATDQANAEVAANIRKDAGKYLLAGYALAQYPSQELESVAELPQKPGDPRRILVEAENYDRGNANKDFTTYGKGIGIIHTVTVPTFAEWDINVASAGSYQLELRYASQEARPVQLWVNGVVVKSDAAAKVTGSFQPEGQRWEAQGIFTMRAGKNTIRIDDNGSIPHIDKLLIVPTPPLKIGPGGGPVRTADQLAAQYGLNPAVLKNAARFFRLRKDGPEFAGWHAVANVSDQAFPATAGKIAERFQTGTGADGVALQAAVNDGDKLLSIPDKPEMLYSDAAKAAVKKAGDAVKTAQGEAPAPVMVMAVEEGKIENVRVHIRGNTETLGDEVPRHFVSVISSENQPAIDSTHSGRLELAQWLTSSTNPLTARVAVNRIWEGHFGQGIVQTPDNFGLLGDRPDHPELLDWLAATFVQQGWSVKKMHRLIMLSSAYQMSSENNAVAEIADPGNRLYWHMNRQRLEAEPFRDAILAVAGKLDDSIGGTLMTTPDNGYVTNDQSGNAEQYNSHRRGIYLPIIRNALYDMFQAFDFGDPSITHAQRASTTVAPQALFVMNSPFVIEQSKAFAASLLADKSATDAMRVKAAYMKAYNRPPTATEQSRAIAYMTKYAAHVAAMEPDPVKQKTLAWESFCQIIYASNEFIYVN